MANASNTRVNGKRLWEAHERMAESGKPSDGGGCRLALTDEDRAARDLFVVWCKEAGCRVSVATVGNIFALR